MVTEREEERYYAARAARRNKLKMRYKGRYFEEIASTREKLTLLEEIAKESVDVRSHKLP